MRLITKLGLNNLVLVCNNEILLYRGRGQIDFQCAC